MTQPNIEEQMGSLVEKMFVLVKNSITHIEELRTQPDGAKKVVAEFMLQKFTQDEMCDQLIPLIEQHPQVWADYQQKAAPQIREKFPALFL